MSSEQRMMGQLATFGQTSFAAAPAFVSGGVLGSAGHTSLVAAPAFASGGGLGSSNFSEARDHNAPAYGAAPAFVSVGMLGSGGDQGQKRERSAPARTVADDEIDDDMLNPGISEARGGHAAHHVASNLSERARARSSDAAAARALSSAHSLPPEPKSAALGWRSREATTASTASTASMPTPSASSSAGRRINGELPRGRFQSELPPEGHLGVLLVAEKPAIAQALATALAPGGRFSKEKGRLPVFSFTGPWVGQGGPQGCAGWAKKCHYRVTSTIGHMYSLDFPLSLRNWGRCDPEDLFDATPQQFESNPDVQVPQHLADEASRCHLVILCLDCDREGEAIGYECLDAVLPNLYPEPRLPHGSSEGLLGVRGNDFKTDARVWRARFSSLAPSDLRAALAALTKPDPLQARSVDARAEIDLKVGISLTRLITSHLRDEVADLAPAHEVDGDKKRGAMISYGPCQTPTLGFCVDRWDILQNFHKDVLQTLDVTLQLPSGAEISLEWEPPANLLSSGHEESTFGKGGAKGKGKSKGKRSSGGFRERGTKNRDVLDSFVAQWRAGASGAALCTANECWEGSIERPTALNTVELLKASSRELGLDPQYTMNVAEKLYLSGLLTYPRTETTSFPRSLDLNDMLKEHSQHPVWGNWCRSLLNGGKVPPRTGSDAGDHPPITPVSCVPEAKVRSKVSGKMGHDAVRIYELIAKRFLAAISPDITFSKRRLSFELNGMRFSLKGNEILDWGFSQISKGAVDTATNFYEMHQRNVLRGPRLDLAKTAAPGAEFTVKSVKVRQLESQPPKLLTESELLTQMEKQQIGTDASMPTHVNNIVTRGYVEVQGPDRLMRPTILGVALIHGLQAVDGELTQAAVRARIENDVSEVAQGRRACEEVVASAVSIFREKFRRVREGIPRIREELAVAKTQRHAWENPTAASEPQQSDAGPEQSSQGQDVVVEPPELQRGPANPMWEAGAARAGSGAASKQLWKGAAVAGKRAREEEQQQVGRNVRQRIGLAGSVGSAGAAGGSSAGAGGLQIGLRVEVRGGDGKPWRAGTVTGQRKKGKWEVLVDGWDKPFVWPHMRPLTESPAAASSPAPPGCPTEPPGSAASSSLEAENKALRTRLAIAQLRAENSEIKFRDMEKKVTKLKKKLGVT